MKSALILVCLTAMAAAQTSNPASTTAAAQSPSGSQGTSNPDPGAAKSRELIGQMVKALGGDAYLHYADVEQEGRTNGFYHGQPTGGTAPFWRFYKFPDK